MTTFPLKIMSFFAAFACIQGAVPVRAAVNMISIEHRVWGDAGASPAKNTYDEAGPVPLSRNCSSMGFFEYYASSSASDWSVNAYRDAYSNYANGYAQNTYIFNPFSEELSISLNGVIGVWWFENKAKMTLTNLSTNSLVSSYYSPSYTGTSPFYIPFDMRNYAFTWDTTVEVNPAHQYELIIYTSAHREEGGYSSASLNLTLVPETGTTLLTAMAVLVLCGRRQRPISAITQ
jgi:hypothetical protein